MKQKIKLNSSGEQATEIIIQNRNQRITRQPHAKRKLNSRVIGKYNSNKDDSQCIRM